MKSFAYTLLSIWVCMQLCNIHHYDQWICTWKHQLPFWITPHEPSASCFLNALQAWNHRDHVKSGSHIPNLILELWGTNLQSKFRAIISTQLSNWTSEKASLSNRLIMELQKINGFQSKHEAKSGESNFLFDQSEWAKPIFGSNFESLPSSFAFG